MRYKDSKLIVGRDYNSIYFCAKFFYLLLQCLLFGCCVYWCWKCMPIYIIIVVLPKNKKVVSLFCEEQDSITLCEDYKLIGIQLTSIFRYGACINIVCDTILWLVIKKIVSTCRSHHEDIFSSLFCCGMYLKKNQQIMFNLEIFSLVCEEINVCSQSQNVSFMFYPHIVW